MINKILLVMKNISVLEIFRSKLCYDIIILSYLKPLSNQNHEIKYCKLGNTNEKILPHNSFKYYHRILIGTGLDMLNLCDIVIVKIKNCLMPKL